VAIQLKPWTIHENAMLVLFFELPPALAGGYDHQISDQL